MIQASPKPSNASRLGMILVGAYVVAICFERIIPIEVFKPYRVIGVLMIMFAVYDGLKWRDKLLAYAAALIVAGAFPSAFTLLGPDGNALYFFSEVAFFVFHVSTYAAIISILKSERDVMIAMGLHAAGMIVAMTQILAESRAYFLLGTVARVSGEFKNPAYACASLMVAFCFTFIIARRFLPKLGFRKSLSHFLLAGLSIVMLYATTHTGSRGGVAAFVVGIVVFVMYLYWKGKNKAVSTLVGVSIIVVVISASQLIEQVVSSQSNILALRIQSKQLENDSRIGLWQAGRDAALDSWGLGVGIGQYRTLHRTYYAPYAGYDPRIAELDMALHNEFLTITTEYGILGLFIYLFMLAEMWRMGSRLKTDEYKAYAYAMFATYFVLAWSTGALSHFTFWVYLSFIAVLSSAAAPSHLRFPSGRRNYALPAGGRKSPLRAPRQIRTR